MDIKSKIKDLKVSEKLKFYRRCMIGLIAFSGVISLLLAFIMNTKLHEITDVWSPSLAHVQELNTLTSEYRLKQYGHLVATDKSTMDAYDSELENLDKRIKEKSAEYQALICTETERKIFSNVDVKWSQYKEQSKKIIELSRANKPDEAGVLMIAEVYDTYKDFNASFQELQAYENKELNAAENIVEIVFIIMILGIIGVVLFAAVAAMRIGVVIGEMITEPIAQLQDVIIKMREGDFSKANLLTCESADELGIVQQKLKETLINLANYVAEISDTLKQIARGDLTKDGNHITNFLGEFSSIKESLLYILKRFNSTLTEIQETSTQVASNSVEISKASQQLAEGANDQASAVEELTATVNTVSNLASESAKATQSAYDQVKAATGKAEIEKQNMAMLTAEMEHIAEISKEIENIITAIEDIASQTNLLSLNASIEAARAGEAGRGFAVVADQIGKLASDSAQSAVNTRELITKALTEIEKGNTITKSTAESFESIIADMKSFAELASQTTKNAHDQASALGQVEQGIEQIATAVQNTAAASEENTAISTNLSERAVQLDTLVKRFKLF